MMMDISIHVSKGPPCIAGPALPVTALIFLITLITLIVLIRPNRHLLLIKGPPKKEFQVK